MVKGFQTGLSGTFGLVGSALFCEASIADNQRMLLPTNARTCFLLPAFEGVCELPCSTLFPGTEKVVADRQVERVQPGTFQWLGDVQTRACLG